MVTGANGLVGSTISADLKVYGRTPPSYNYRELGKRWVDLTDWGSTHDLFMEIKPTQVIHYAGRVGGVWANMNHLGEFFHESMAINLNVLEAARKTGVKKVVSFLSTCIYPDQVEYPLTEDKIHEGEPHSSNFAYAYAKRMLEVQSRAYNKQYGLNYVCVVPTNIYGPKDNFNLESGHVVPSLIHKCYLAKRDNTDLVVWGSGKPLREFIFSKDVGKLTKWALENYEEDLPIIFSNSQEISIRELVETIIEVMGFNGKIIFDDSKPDGQYRKPTDNSKLMSYLPDFQFTPLKEGIKKTVNWFLKNYESCRK